MMLEVVLVSTFAFIAMTSCTLDSVCNHTPVDQGDHQSIQIAQLEAIRCQIIVLKTNHADSMAAIVKVHNDTMNMQDKILNAIKSISQNYNFISIVGFCVSSIIFALIFKSIVASVWFYTVQKSDRLAEFLMFLSNLKARWWNSALPTYHTVDQYRDSRPVPTLLVIIRCCSCKKFVTERTDDMQLRRVDV